METSDVARAVSAARSVAVSLGLPVADALVLHNSNKLAVRLTPCDVVARVTHEAEASAGLEVERAHQLVHAGCPVGVPEPRVESRVYLRDGFAVTLWVYYPPEPDGLSAADYAGALQRLHSGMRMITMPTPTFRDRIADADQVAANPDLSPELSDVDRAFLGSMLRSSRAAIDRYGAVEHLIHGEPHPGNVLATSHGALFIDFETVCSGPVEFDLAHVPESVCGQYPGIDKDLLDDCRHLVLAMVAAWRWRIGDDFPDRRRWGRDLLHALRAGPPWPTLDAMTRRFGGEDPTQASSSMSARIRSR